jgi:histidinol phosphatase-like PHP family hydrolase
MIDLHIHSIFSDGELIPSEIVSRARKKGYRALAFTDHVDTSNLEFVLRSMVKVAKDLSLETEVTVLPGVEITHVPPTLIPGLVREARERGALIVIVHGETIVEPVPPGTNREAIAAGADILAHPGLISEEDALLAAKKGVLLELTSRMGHSYTNGHVVAVAKKTKARMIFNTDAHSPGDFLDREEAWNILRGAGLDPDMISTVFDNAEELVQKRS